MRNHSIVLTLALAGLGLAACNQQSGQNATDQVTGAPAASLPLAQGAPPPLVDAPSADALPSAPPAKYVNAPPQQRYRYIDRAYSLGQAFADSPPDYAVDYQGVRPWVWRSDDGEYRVVEPTPDGDRTYYFDSSSDEPYLVRDPRYAYGYDQGGLAVIYENGRPVDYDADQAERAARYLARARAIYDAAVHQRRQQAYAEAWRQRQSQVISQQRAWEADQQRQADWRAWRDQQQQQQQQQAAQIDRERSMRMAYAARVAASTGNGQSRSGGIPPALAPVNGQPSGQPGQRRDERQFQAQQQQQAFDAQRAQNDAAAKQAEAARQAQAAQTALAQQRADAARKAQADATSAQAKREADARQAQAAQTALAQQRADAARKSQADAAAAQAKREADARQAQAAQSALAQQRADAAKKSQADAAAAQAKREQAAREAQAAQTALAKKRAEDAAAKKAQDDKSKSANGGK